MRLHQLKLDFIPEHDRLLLRVSTDNQLEVRLWLTRRALRLMWPLLVQMVRAAPEIAARLAVPTIWVGRGVSRWGGGGGGGAAGAVDWLMQPVVAKVEAAMRATTMERAMRVRIEIMILSSCLVA